MTLTTKLWGYVGVAIVAASTVACGPGLSHRVKQPAQVRIDAATEAELARAIGVTTLSSETVKLEEPAAEASRAPRTWGGPDAQNAQSADEPMELPATRN